MSEQPWAMHRGWTTETVQAEIVAAFPQFAGAEVRYLDEGFDFQVYLVAGEWAFKFPKRDDYARQVLVERDLLESIHPDCPIQIPRYSFVAEIRAGDVIGGYRLLEGRPAHECDPAGELAPGSAALLAAFVSHVHAFDAGSASDLGVAAYRPELGEKWRWELQGELEEVAARLDPYLARLARDAISELDLALPLAQIAPTLNHGDLAPEHILLDPESGRITGVIDWSDAFVGDPAYDFGGILAWRGEAFANTVLALCTRDYDSGLMDRARAYGLNYIVGTLDYGLAGDRAAHWNAGLLWLQSFVGR